MILPIIPCCGTMKIAASVDDNIDNNEEKPDDYARSDTNRQTT